MRAALLLFAACSSTPAAPPSNTAPPRPSVVRFSATIDGKSVGPWTAISYLDDEGHARIVLAPREGIDCQAMTEWPGDDAVRLKLIQQLSPDGSLGWRIWQQGWRGFDRLGRPSPRLDEDVIDVRTGHSSELVVDDIGGVPRRFPSDTGVLVMQGLLRAPGCGREKLEDNPQQQGWLEVEGRRRGINGAAIRVNKTGNRVLALGTSKVDCGSDELFTSLGDIVLEIEMGSTLVASLRGKWFVDDKMYRGVASLLSLTAIGPTFALTGAADIEHYDLRIGGTVTPVACP